MADSIHGKFGLKGDNAFHVEKLNTFVLNQVINQFIAAPNNVFKNAPPPAAPTAPQLVDFNDKRPPFGSMNYLV